MNENEQRLNNNSNEWNYITVIFENRMYHFDDRRVVENAEFRNAVYGNSTEYTYKIKRDVIKDLVEGRVLKITTNSGPGLSRVLVTKINLKEEDIKFPLDKIKEIPLYEG